MLRNFDGSFDPKVLQFLRGILYGVEVKIEVIDPEFKPKYQHDWEDAGADVKAYDVNEKFKSGVIETAAGWRYVLEPGKQVLIGCGFKCALPQNYAFLVCPRSGLAVKHRITVLNAPGICDRGYRGEYGVILFNAGDELFEINKGDRIAQIVLTYVPTAIFNETKSLEVSARGYGGFGSTGGLSDAAAEPLPIDEKPIVARNDEFYVETDPLTGQMKYHVPTNSGIRNPNPMNGITVVASPDAAKKEAVPVFAP